MPRGSIDERKRVDVIREAGVYHARQSGEWFVCTCVHLLSHGGDHQIPLVQDGKGILVAPYFKH